MRTSASGETYHHNNVTTILATLSELYQPKPNKKQVIPLIMGRINGSTLSMLICDLRPGRCRSITGIAICASIW